MRVSRFRCSTTVRLRAWNLSSPCQRQSVHRSPFGCSACCGQRRHMWLDARRPAELSPVLRRHCDAAARGEPVPIEGWLELSETAISMAASLGSHDVLAVLRACELQNVDDASLFAALAARLESLAPQLAVNATLEAVELLLRLEARAEGPRRLASERPIDVLYHRLEDLAGYDGPTLVRIVSVLSRQPAPPAETIRSLVATTVRVRGLDFFGIISLEVAFEAFGVLHSGVAELLQHRRRHFLASAPLPSLLRALRETDGEVLASWVLRSAHTEVALLTVLERRLEALGDDSASVFSDPFECLDALIAKQRLPTAFLRSLCHWTKRRVRKQNRDGQAFSDRLVTASRLCTLDDACEARHVDGVARDDLDGAIRSLVVFGLLPDTAAVGFGNSSK